ncbi:2,3-dihydro-2,3-dihydroxybenzoate dehydrogenase [Teredinibacter purpureus]|jgi:Dehydrogenases with different specificities (related to short-chain alcohol dehydrogenases)|uniref:2,3-dihydro-2,3-dihydroxybenzoate dehydrogenase n=1 Tax=Teredinibacter purpureus TaxID=2731756 RepID=UPI0005F80533|nr:2,3-dihydro-2,3-dihydroxybenzoate dehydrogenase [Teredinibacter purpureus]
MTFRFDHKIVWVTGAGSGIGRAVGQLFHALGATVIAIDKTFATDGEFSQYVTVDISQPEKVAETCDKLLADHGRVDIFVSAAGILTLSDIEHSSLREWDDIMAVNVSAPFYFYRHIAPVFKQQKTGCVVAIASNAAQVPRMNMAAYGASKAALISLTQTLGLELSAYGVRCNCISPGSTRTPMLQQLGDGAMDEPGIIEGTPAEYKLGIPLKKLATPHDIAQSVCFLASDYSHHITLQNLVVDGGATLGC